MSEFHFLRPWWLIAAVPCVLLAWRLRTASDPLRSWRKIIAPELLPHLRVRANRTAWFSPVLLLPAGWLTATLALAGPTWEREPAPFADDTAALVIVLKVTSSMQTEDIQPTRLTRAVQKIHDLLELRPGAKTALVAYSGSAHQVMPLTSDAGIVDAFAEELVPDVMPKEGDEPAKALELAHRLITKSGQRGWILWISDAAPNDQIAAIKSLAENQLPPVSVLAVVGQGTEQQSLMSAASALNASFINVAPDDADVRPLAANTRFSAASDGSTERWRDDGYWLVPLVIVISLFWFRPGWAMGGAA